MKYDLTRRKFVIGTAATAGALTLAGPRAFAADPLKVGFVYVGPIGDYGWTHGHELGREAVVHKFGDKVKTTYVENVAEGPDAERVIRQLASSGHGLIFTTSFGFMNPTIRVAKQFRKVKFEHATGYQTAPNVAVYNARFHEGRSICGAIAGHVSKSGIVGYIASFPIPEVVMGINAFTLAAQKVRPDIKVKVVWINSWYDPGKEGDGAKTLIDQGADIVCQHTDSPAPLQTAEARGVHGFGQASDMKAYAPKAQLTAILDDWSGYYVQRVQDVLDGKWKSHNIWWGLKEGMVKMSPYGDAVPEKARKDADAIRDGIIAGTVHPFAGPIKNQEGKVVVAEGKSMSDEELQKMDWYVQGVEA
ncbi:MAG: BMP family ABC transporter substrate-binding protein [Alphaproteobacteria bacterium]|nr:BMP family ABC transporter substrate-binding protein [Alphaproteobacteria bacterium]